MRPVAIINTEQERPTKKRRVTIIKEEVYRDIDLVTYKFAEGRGALSSAEGNAVSSDSTERLDGALLARYVSDRDTMLRTFIQYALAEEIQYEADNIQGLEDRFVYLLKVSESFNDSMLKPLATFIHRYLVRGTLYDWYAGLGSEQAAVYGRELEDIENKINGLLRTPSRVKRPLQPFGPAKRNGLL